MHSGGGSRWVLPFILTLPLCEMHNWQKLYTESIEDLVPEGHIGVPCSPGATLTSVEIQRGCGRKPTGTSAARTRPFLLIYFGLAWYNRYDAYIFHL